MKLQQLELLCALEQYHSFAQAAQHLFMSQPALSNSLKALEEELQCTLLSRSNKGIQFTGTGRLALEKAHEIINDVMFIRSLARQSQSKPEHMSIASNTLTCIDLLAHVYFLIEHDAPDIAINFREIDEHTLIHQLLYGSLDFALLQINDLHPSGERAKLEQKHPLYFIELKQEPLAIMLNQNHPLAEKQNLSISDMFPYRFVTAHSETDHRLIHALHDRGYDKEPMLLQDSACLNQLIANSTCWVFVSQNEAIRHQHNKDNRFAFLYPADFPSYCLINWVGNHEKYPDEEALLLNALERFLSSKEAMP